MMEHYKTLDIDSNATPEQIKRAYHRALLGSHPDKPCSNPTNDINQIKLAYYILSSPERRALYDTTTPPPTQVISLEQFQEDGDGRYIYLCRCSGQYSINYDDLLNGLHLLICSSCSQVIWVGYKLDE